MKQEIFDNVLKELYCQVTDELRNIVNPFFSLVEVCEIEYDKLPEIVKEIVKPAKQNIERYKRLDVKISKILGKLPEEKRKEYYEYYRRKEIKSSTTYHPNKS